MDVDCGMCDERLNKAVANLQEFGTVNMLGTFPRYQEPYQPTMFAFGV